MKNKKGFVLSTYIYVLLVFFLLLLVVMLSVLNNTKLLSKKLQEQSESETALKSSSFSLVLLGNKEIELEEGSSFTDPGVIASSKTGLDLTYKVTTVSTVDTSKQGEYQISYRLTYNGITKEVVRNVKVSKNIKIYFDTVGGSKVIEYMNASVGDFYGDLPVPIKDGKAFAGWYTSLDYDIRISEDDVVSSDTDVTLYALWIDGEYAFSYLASEQTFTVPADGYYKLEVWGAQGGNDSSITGGYGGYSSGYVVLKKNQILYINTGGQGSSGVCGSGGGYNGGSNAGSSGTSGAGGGATHIATVSGLLSTLNNNIESILIVAGGGGGGGEGGSNGHAGGYMGNASSLGSGGTQSTGYKFGQGGPTSGDGGGGGGGFYGGTAGAGGSGYIGNSLLSNKVMYCYNCNADGGHLTKTITTTNVNASATSNYVKTGNGYAKITFVSLNGSTDNYEINEYDDFYYLGSEQIYTIPKKGTYKLEVWGAQGGSDSSISGGYGGYSIGYIDLEESQILYINVGGQGSSGVCGSGGGYNGGSNAGSSGTSGAGGGATHIATVSGLLSTLSDDIKSLLIVAGGAGGGGEGGSNGHAGGYTGNASTLGSGGTQSTGYKFGQGGPTSGDGGGGGGGLYGGTAGAGGSGYIGNSLLSNKSMYCYNCTESSDASTKTVSTTCTNATATSNCSKQGNGYAKITLISE